MAIALSRDKPSIKSLVRKKSLLSTYFCWEPALTSLDLHLCLVSIHLTWKKWKWPFDIAHLWPWPCTPMTLTLHTLDLNLASFWPWPCIFLTLTFSFCRRYRMARLTVIPPSPWPTRWGRSQRRSRNGEKIKKSDWKRKVSYSECFLPSRDTYFVICNVEHTYDACAKYSELGIFRIIAYLYVSDGSRRWQR